LTKSKSNFLDYVTALNKGAFGERRQQEFYNKVQPIYSKTALEYWQSEIVNKAEGTKASYLHYFKDFLTYVNMTADQVLDLRIQDTASPDRRIQRRFESLFKVFLAEGKKKNYAPLTLQTIFASVRSFFEAHYYPLIMRKSDYPTGDSNGAKRATKEQILKALGTKTESRTTTALIMTAKDSALRVSDMRLLKCDVILDNPDADVIPIQRITKKTKLLAKTFIGEEAITALKAYLEHRRKGTRNVPPEKITKDSPLFRTWAKGEVKPMSREGMSTLIRNAFLAAGIKKVSAHSLRRYYQTAMEEANVNVNWIDQMLGHELVNCRGAYSKPTDEQLEASYVRAYDNIRVYPKVEPIHKETAANTITATNTGEENLDVAEARNMTEAKALLAKGYKYEMEMDGVKLFTKK
jgi:integrase